MILILLGRRLREYTTLVWQTFHQHVQLSATFRDHIICHVSMETGDLTRHVFEFTAVVGKVIHIVIRYFVAGTCNVWCFLALQLAIIFVFLDLLWGLAYLYQSIDEIKSIGFVFVSDSAQWGQICKLFDNLSALASWCIWWSWDWLFYHLKFN